MTTDGPTGVDGPPAIGFRQAVLDDDAYVSSGSGVERSTCLRLDRNEGSRPVPAAVRAALVEQIDGGGVHTYPDTDRIAAPLGAYCGVAADSIMATNGSDEAISLVLSAFLAEGRRMVVAQPEFPVFGHAARLTGAIVTGVPFDADLVFPYTAFRDAAAARADLIVIINPNNPTGTPVDREFIEEMVVAHPGVPVVVDEAYQEFTGVTVVDLTANHPNLIVLRTFSKAFAMAGLRLGYAVAHPATTAVLKRLRNVYAVNELALVAAAAHLDDLDSQRTFVNETMNVVKPMVVDYFDTAGVTIWPGAANFMLVHPGDRDAAVEHLRTARILVRPMDHPLIAGTFRMSLGSAAEMERFIDVYAELLEVERQQRGRG